MAAPKPARQRTPILIALVYAIFGAAWVVFGDQMWLQLTYLSREELARLQTFTGLVYIALISALVWYMVQRAMSEVARAETARGASEARYRQIFERSTPVTWVLDVASMRIIDANPAAVMFYGWPRSRSFPSGACGP
jgi:PAS domain-containing protein